MHVLPQMVERAEFEAVRNYVRGERPDRVRMKLLESCFQYRFPSWPLYEEHRASATPREHLAQGGEIVLHDFLNCGLDWQGSGHRCNLKTSGPWPRSSMGTLTPTVCFLEAA